MPVRRQIAEFGQRTVVAVLITLLLLAVAFLVVRGFHVLLQAFAGVLFAIFLYALSEWLSKHTRIPYGWALTAVVIGLFCLVGGVGYFLANRLATQLGELTQQLPDSIEHIRLFLSEHAWGRFVLEQMSDPLASKTPGQDAHATRLVLGGVNLLVAAIVILFVGIFGAADPSVYKEGLVHVVPYAYRPRVQEAISAVIFNLRSWLVGQVFLMVLIGITTTIGLWLIGVPLALTLGVIAGILELVPYVGPWVSAVPAALIALLVSPWHALAVLGLYLAIHILEGYVLVPLIQQRSVHMAPALTLVSQVLLGDLFGLPGLFVAAPLTAMVLVLLKMLYVEDTLGDQAVSVPGEPGNENKPESQVS